MNHVVLLGDSVFDNRAYVGRDPAVAQHLTAIVPHTWNVTLAAVDGSTVTDVAAQLSRIPADATHFIVSVGGNDALMHADILTMAVKSSSEFLSLLSDRSSVFEERYRRMLARLLKHKMPTAVSTIYYPNFTDRVLQKVAIAALSSFNDVIIRNAAAEGIPILDLRLICSEPDDYANEIEPSGMGGAKIAEAIRKLLLEHDFLTRRSAIYL